MLVDWHGIGDIRFILRVVVYFVKRKRINPNVAKAGGIQSQGAKGEAVALYCDPLATLDLESSGFPGRVKK